MTTNFGYDANHRLMQIEKKIRELNARKDAEGLDEFEFTMLFDMMDAAKALRTIISFEHTYEKEV